MLVVEPESGKITPQIYQVPEASTPEPLTAQRGIHLIAMRGLVH